MNIADINSSLMIAANDVADATGALVAGAAAGLSPQVTSNASPFDIFGKAAAAGAVVDGAATDFLGKAEQALANALAVVSLTGPALASLTRTHRS
ncbi:hypothetical protein ACFFJT_05310 [Dyella flava]|uniref:Killing trait domain-containing protein n=1 Tax=Dyella flava TaxID=1920170 RepID=A0ABS2K6F0_9GAMM|nr:hypothetical protein [Dyella flava]MBM7126772.1 hypothetical protein [Dyella flava]GLQ49405.1 hypothetical protein GCM10010872_08540 [Dyella flava]